MAIPYAHQGRNSRSRGFAAPVSPPLGRQHVLVSVSNPQHSTLLALLLEEQGWIVRVVYVHDWLAQAPGPELPVDVVLLEAWAVEDPVLLSQAQARIARIGAPLVLLVDGPADGRLVERLGAAATLPLLFEYDDLTRTLRQALRSRARTKPRGGHGRLVARPHLCGADCSAACALWR